MKRKLSTTSRSATLSLLSMALLAAAGCTTTEKVKLDQASINCGLLNGDCNLLTPTDSSDKTSLRYVSPNVQWTQYNKVMIDPVTFWGGDTTKVSASDQQTLVNYFNQQLREKVGQKMQVVDQPGPGVLKLQVAMTDADTATPVLRSVSMIVPQAHMLANLKYLATGTFPFVGSAQAEAKITDAVTGKVLAEAVDKRIGGGMFTTGFQWELGDAEHAIDKWCEIAADRLSGWTSGKETP